MMREEAPFMKFMEFKFNKHSVYNVIRSFLAKKAMPFKALSARMTYILFIGKYIDFPYSQTSMGLEHYSTHCLIFLEPFLFSFHTYFIYLQNLTFTKLQ